MPQARSYNFSGLHRIRTNQPTCTTRVDFTTGDLFCRRAKLAALARSV